MRTFGSNTQLAQSNLARGAKLDSNRIANGEVVQTVGSRIERMFNACARRWQRVGQFTRGPQLVAPGKVGKVECCIGGASFTRDLSEHSSDAARGKQFCPCAKRVMITNARD